MASWRDLVEAEPAFAEEVRALLDRHRHKTIVTLRRDGSPRISGIEALVVGDDLWFGGMPDSRKVREVVLTRLGEPADHLLIASWHEGRGLQRIARR
jgi:hypothetical protein